MALFSPITPLDRLHNRRLDWSIKVRVVRMWNVKSSLDPRKVNEIHLILIDEEGTQMQACAPSQCVDHWSHLFVENGVYLISYFHVLHNVSSSMFVFSLYKLLLCMTTVVFPSHSLVIPNYSLSLFLTSKIKSYKNTLDYLVDFIGSPSRMYSLPDREIGSGLETVVRVTLADMRGSCDCFLFGTLAEEVKTMLFGCTSDNPILVFRFVRIKYKQGCGYLESVEDITQVLLNPPFVEVEQFKMDMGYTVGSQPLVKKELYSSSKSCKELEFNHLYPHTGMDDFIHNLEDGIFVLCGKIFGVFQVNQWFYPVCECGAFLNDSDGLYHCLSCKVSVFVPTSKCNFQIGIEDMSTVRAVFPMAESLLQGIESVVDHGGSIAVDIDGKNKLCDKLVMIIVKKATKFGDSLERYIEVLRMTDDIDIIKRFDLHGQKFTPIKRVFEGKPIDISALWGNIEEICSSSSGGVGRGKKLLVDDDLQVLENRSSFSCYKKKKQLKLANHNVIYVGTIVPEASSTNMI